MGWPSILTSSIQRPSSSDFAQLAPILLRDGALRFTIDHVDLHPLGPSLNDVGCARGSVFATQPVLTAEPAVDVDVRIGTATISTPSPP